MAIERKVPGEIRIFLNHVYEFKKGVRNMVLYTMNKEHEAFAIRRLERQNISYLIQEVNANKINLFFGKAECMDAIRHIIIRPLNHLTPEEDFILGAMLGYDICQQCKRYCNKKPNYLSTGYNTPTASFFLHFIKNVIPVVFSVGNLFYKKTIN